MGFDKILSGENLDGLKTVSTKEEAPASSTLNIGGEDPYPLRTGSFLLTNRKVGNLSTYMAADFKNIHLDQMKIGAFNFGVNTKADLLSQTVSAGPAFTISGVDNSITLNAGFGFRHDSHAGKFDFSPAGQQALGGAAKSEYQLSTTTPVFNPNLQVALGKFLIRGDVEIPLKSGFSEKASGNGYGLQSTTYVSRTPMQFSGDVSYLLSNPGADIPLFLTAGVGTSTKDVNFAQDVKLSGVTYHAEGHNKNQGLNFKLGVSIGFGKGRDNSSCHEVW